MQTEIEKFAQITQYLKGQLSEDARILFEAEIGVAAQLRSEIEMHRLLNETIVDNYLIDVKQKTKAVLQQKKTQQNKKKSRFPKLGTRLADPPSLSGAP